MGRAHARVPGAAFNPVGYHTGTVWPHDNAMTAVGLRKYGFDRAFLRIFDDLLEGAATSGYRLPELFAGFSRADYEDPVPYPVACSPQAWAAGALPCMPTAGLGLVPDGLRGILRIRRPALPRLINRLEPQGLSVAGSRVDLVFERVASTASVALTDVRIDGDVEVVLASALARTTSRRPWTAYNSRASRRGRREQPRDQREGSSRPLMATTVADCPGVLGRLAASAPGAWAPRLRATGASHRPGRRLRSLSSPRRRSRLDFMSEGTLCATFAPCASRRWRRRRGRRRSGWRGGRATRDGF